MTLSLNKNVENVCKISENKLQRKMARGQQKIQSQQKAAEKESSQFLDMND